MSWQYACFLVSENFTYLFFATPDLLSLELIRLVRAVKLVPPSISCCFAVWLVQGGLVLCHTSPDLQESLFQIEFRYLCRTNTY